MVYVLRSPPLLAHMAFLTCSIYFVCKKMRGPEFGEVPGKVSAFSIFCAAGTVVPLYPITDEIAIVERTIQDSHPMAKSEDLGKIC